VITEGRAIVQRNDLRPSSDLVVAQHDGLGLLFLCAAWQGSHESRRSHGGSPTSSIPITARTRIR